MSDHLVDIDKCLSDLDASESISPESKAALRKLILEAEAQAGNASTAATDEVTSTEDVASAEDAGSEAGGHEGGALTALDGETVANNSQFAPNLLSGIEESTQKGVRATVLTAVSCLVASVFFGILVQAWYGASTDRVLRDIRDANRTTQDQMASFRRTQVGLLAALLGTERSPSYASAVVVFGDRAGQYNEYATTSDLELFLAGTLFRSFPRLSPDEVKELCDVFASRALLGIDLVALRRQLVSDLKIALSAAASRPPPEGAPMLAQFLPDVEGSRYPGCYVCLVCTRDTPCPACADGVTSAEVCAAIDAEISSLEDHAAQWSPGPPGGGNATSK